MKKVIFFIDNLGSGGAQRQIVNLAVLMKKAGHDAKVIYYGEHTFYKPILDENGVPSERILAKGNISRILNVRKYIRKSKADVVIAFLETPGFIACLSKIGHKTPKLITNERSSKISTFTSKRNRFFNKFEAFSDAKVGNSHRAIRMWQMYYPQYNDKYSVIYNPVMMPEEFVGKEHRYLSDGKLHIVVAASYQELKNPLRLIEAVKMLPDEKKARLVINWFGRAEVTLGNTEIYDKAQALVSEYGLSECIKLCGETSEIYSEMCRSDVVALFSTVEGLPNTICEGMTVGRPIIMSTVSDYDTLVTDNGFLCDPLDEKSISDAISKMLDMTESELSEMGNASAKKAQELFSPRAITERWIDLIEKITRSSAK